MNEGSGGEAKARYEDDASPFQQPARPPLLQRLVPITEHVRSYRAGTLRRDLLAGVTVAALALPASLAYAEIAGLSLLLLACTRCCRQRLPTRVSGWRSRLPR